jgi:hypothetical protein
MPEDLENNMPTLITVKVDYENPAERWWAALQEREPGIAARLSDGEEQVTAEELDRLQALPGWSDGPAYARTALIVLGPTVSADDLRRASGTADVGGGNAVEDCDALYDK